MEPSRNNYCLISKKLSDYPHRGTRFLQNNEYRQEFHCFQYQNLIRFSDLADPILLVSLNNGNFRKFRHLLTLQT